MTYRVLEGRRPHRCFAHFGSALVHVSVSLPHLFVLRGLLYRPHRAERLVLTCYEPVEEDPQSRLHG